MQFSAICTYQSVGPARTGQVLSRRGSRGLRTAIIELGRGLSQRDPHFARYRQDLLDRRMPPLKAQFPSLPARLCTTNFR